MTGRMTIAHTLSTLGYEWDDAVDTSVQLTARADQLTWLHNLGPDIATHAIRAALVGEHEPIQRFLPDFSTATIRAKLTEPGLPDLAEPTTTEVTRARVALILEQADQQVAFHPVIRGEADPLRRVGVTLEELTRRPALVGWLARKLTLLGHRPLVNRIVAYWSTHPHGGALHTILEDKNLETPILQHAILNAEAWTQEWHRPEYHCDRPPLCAFDAQRIASDLIVLSPRSRFRVVRTAQAKVE